MNTKECRKIIVFSVINTCLIVEHLAQMVTVLLYSVSVSDEMLSWLRFSWCSPVLDKCQD
jgi:hypothetical protein